MSFASSHQDWGGRRRDNPKGAPRVTREQVFAKAAHMGIQVRRPYGAWTEWMYFDSDCWRNLERTNYLALKRLEAMAKGKTE